MKTKEEFIKAEIEYINNRINSVKEISVKINTEMKLDVCFDGAAPIRLEKKYERDIEKVKNLSDEEYLKITTYDMNKENDLFEKIANKLNLSPEEIDNMLVEDINALDFFLNSNEDKLELIKLFEEYSDFTENAPKYFPKTKIS